MNFLIEHRDALIAGLLLPALLILETIVMLTPTKSDDGFVERVGGLIRKALQMLGVPNRLKAEKDESPK